MKYEFKGTQGQWGWDGKVWCYDKENEAPWLVSDNNKVLTGEIECPNEADAHLIAAAPELLNACIEAMGELEYNFQSNSTITVLKNAIHKALNIKA